MHRLLLGGVLALSACKGAQPPPDLNAADPSLTCEAGQVGWDFSTGGHGDDVKVLQRSNEIRIVEATVGVGCDASAGNRTDSFATSCNGMTTCSRPAFLSTETNPVPGCFTSRTNVRYQCGAEETVYEAEFSALGFPDEVRVACGPKLTIVSASIGKNCGITAGGATVNTGNATAGLLARCNGLRMCSLPRGLREVATGQFSMDGCGGQTVPTAEVQFTCGSDPTVFTRQGADYDWQTGEPNPLRFGCDPSPSRSTVAIRVRSARFGGLDLAAKFKGACDGRTTCTRPLLMPGETDPQPGESRDFTLEYDCGAGGSQDPVRLTTSTNQTITLRCSVPMTVTDATVGKDCNATESARESVEFKRLLTSRCNNRGRCSIPAPYTSPRAWMTNCTTDQRALVVTYTCGASTEVTTQRLAWNGPIEVSCPAAPAPDHSLRGIRILEASRGLGCPGVPPERLRNNLYANAYTCTGRDACTMSTALPVQAPECASPDVQVSYRCGEDEEVHTVSGLVSSLGASVQLSCEPAVTVHSATFGGNCANTTTGNATTALAQQCNGRLGTCSFGVNHLGLAAAPTDCSPTFTATYRCGPDPTLKTATLSADASQATGVLTCAVPTTPYVRKACVPQQCIGTTRRDENLACVSDLTKTVIPAPSKWSLFTSESESGQVRQNWPMSVLVSTTFDQALSSSLPYDTELAQATVYAVDRFTQRVNGGREYIEGFRCVVANPGLRRPRANVTIAKVDSAAIAAGKVLVAQANNFVAPANCFGANVPSWRDAMRRYRQQTGTTVSEADFRQAFMLSETELRVAFDPEGKTVALRTAGTTEATALVPNPIGFFYNPPLLWVDFLSFYEQTRLPLREARDGDPSDLSLRPLVRFRTSNAIVFAATKATLRRAEAEVDLYDATRLPLLELDFDWIMAGDSPGRNPFSPSQVLSTSIPNTSQRHLGATVEILPKSVFDANAGSPLQWYDAMVVGAVQGTPLGEGQPTGTTTRVMATFTEALRSRLVLVKNSENNGWMDSQDEAMREFKVRACIDMDAQQRMFGMELAGAGERAQRGDEDFRVMLGAPPTDTYRRCVVADQVFIVRRTMEQKLLPHDHDGADTQVGQSVDQGNGDVNNATDMANVGTCTRRCTITADCGSGQTCSSGVCTGGSSSRCSSETRNSSGGTGVFGASMLRTSTSSVSDDNQDSGGSATSTGTGELLGFNILQQSSSSAWTTPGTKGTFTINPDWDVLIDVARQGVRAASEAALLQPIIAPARFVGGRKGLGIGLGRSFFIFIGPIPIVAEVSLTAGFGLSLQFDFDLNSDYPCIGTQQCYVVHSEQRSLAEANSICQDAGGQLAELSSANALAGTRAAITDTTLQYWVGGQQAVLWPQPSCARTPNDPSCINQSQTRYRWIKSNTPFAEQHALGAELFNTSSYAAAFGGSSSQLSALRPRVPSLGGVTFQKASSAGNDALRSSSETDLRPFVCEFAPASKARASTWSAGIVLSAAVGASFSLCVPHSSLGICLSAGLNFVDAQMGFAFERANTRRWDSQGLLVSSVGTDAFKITASLSFITGAISVEVKLLFFSISYDLVTFDGVSKLQWELYQHEFPTRQ